MKDGCSRVRLRFCEPRVSSYVAISAWPAPSRCVTLRASRASRFALAWHRLVRRLVRGDVVQISRRFAAIAHKCCADEPTRAHKHISTRRWVSCTHACVCALIGAFLRLWHRIYRHSSILYAMWAGPGRRSLRLQEPCDY